MRAKWLLIVLGPTLFMLAASVLVILSLPHPVPKNATPAQRIYLSECATCHGANGRGSWRATLFLLRPGNLADPKATESLPDEYLFNLIKDGGATIGKPGMPAFGFHLSDEEIREVMRYVRQMPARERR